ncbi:MAG: Omp28 family outer membrane lipoprotein [Bacteroidota bacterium]|nr:Omp28 family outer membrane lipoprotein [Bacteroidota bacterium]
MKKIILVFVSILSISIVSCDKVSHAAQTSEVKPNTRNILLEDYTGHQCGNCPNAARVAEQLQAKYGDKLIVIAVHAGFFTRLNTEFVTSYTCQAGNDWDASTGGFGVSAAGNPNGMVNRKNYADNGLIQKETKWATTVSLASSDIEFCDLFLTTSYDALTRKLNTSVKTKFRRSYPNNTKLCVVFTEDSVIGPQKDYSLAPNPDVIHDYEFMHMLRGSINGSWGETLKNAPIKYQDSVTLSYPNFALEPKFKDKNVSVIAFVYDATTREVLQVEKAKIK